MPTTYVAWHLIPGESSFNQKQGLDKVKIFSHEWLATIYYHWSHLVMALDGLRAALHHWIGLAHLGSNDEYDRRMWKVAPIHQSITIVV